MRSVALFAVITSVLPVVGFAQSALNLTPSRVVGQPAVNFRSASPNLVEGREVLNPWAVAVDRTSNAAVLYVSDTGNNRVLAWRNIGALQNGAPADFVLGQVDRISTQPGGPGTSRTGGLSAPGALAVDRQGNLYVVDTGNNRVVRFRRPADSTDEVQFPDFIIGQPTLTTDTANLGGVPTAKTLSLATTTTAGRTGLAFDAQGNLWLTDSLNNRVLRYPAAALTAGVNQPDADIVLGQPDFGTVTPAPTTPTGDVPPVLNKAAMRAPSGVAVDPDGRVYVSDGLGRVLVYTTPVTTGREAARVLGISVQQPGQLPRYDYLLQAPQSLFMVGNRLGVADPALNRVVIYDAFAEWPAETAELPSPAIRTAIGQVSTTEIRSNRGLPEPNETTLSSPVGAYYSGTELVVADTGNQRVLVYPTTTMGAGANRVLGQTNFTYNAPNLIEGKEMFVFSSFSSFGNLSAGIGEGGGIAIDSTSNPPRMYVADTFNNRILGYKDARLVRPGDRADIVIGQTDLNRSLVNSPSNSGNSLSATGLFRPSGVAIDGNGNLWVADSGNSRVLRFPAPFAQTIPAGERHRADLVIGQTSFTQKITDPTSRTMAYPFGLAFTVDGHLLVSDAIHSRILFFRLPANGQFVNGQAAERVIGQPDFFSAGGGTGQRRLNSPRHISTDTDDRLYVADAGNNRVLVYDRITVVENDPSPAFALTGVSAPEGVFVSKLTGEIWVANTRGNAATRFPIYQRLAITTAADYNIPSNAPMALTQDAFGNLYVVEGANRVAIYYNALKHTIAGNYVERALSPGAIANLWPAGSGFQFATNAEGASSLPLPRTLADIQVLVNDQPTPLYYVGLFQINFLVPMNSPTSGDAEVQVVRQSTGQVIAVGRLPFDRVSPALFTIDAQAEGPVAALNEDNTMNSPSNPIPVGRVIQMFGTGQGFVPNAPPDGTAPTGALSSQERPRVIIGSDFVPDANIEYSGLAPGFVGLWQINVRIPQNVAPSSAVDVVVQLRSINSNTPPAGFPRPRLRTTISVRAAQ